MAEAHLALAGLSKSYDGKRYAVEAIDLAIAKGEFVTFLGPSGSGKTTTLMMIAGFEQPSGGRITLGGRSIAEVPPWKRNIGMVFQNYALFPHMTALQNVAFPLRMRKRPAAENEKRARAALAMVGLADFAARHPRELSGGQQQRVALARALVFEPDVLLLDEPLGALDKNLREQMQVEIKRIHRELGVTSIYVTHDQTEAMTMSDRIAVFSHGRIEQFAAPLDVYFRPATRFVGGFVGDSNFFAAEADGSGMLQVEGLGRLQGPPSAGGRYHVLVRPESIRLVGEGEAPADTNLLPFRIDGIVNYGDSVLMLGESGGQPLRVRLPGRDAAALREGDTPRVGWRREDAHLIPA